MKKIVLSLALMGLLVVSIPAAAEICTIDDVPAATLLLPYFEVDLNPAPVGDPPGITTLFSVTNASAAAQLVHVVVWSDLSVPVLDFNIYLTGYDVQTVNLADIIIRGRLPRTASAGQDPADTISPQGDFSQDINFASCAGQLPPPATLPASFIQHLQNSLTGQASNLLGGLCAGQALGDNIARGYVTMDVVNNCTLRFPGDPGYLTADINFDNVLFGDYFYVNEVENFAQGETLVHIEACPFPSVSNFDACLFAPGDYTFYGRYETIPFVSDEDQREPLAQTFAARYITGGAFDGGTDFIVWRDAKVDQAPFTCPARTSPSRPPWYPLGQNAIVIFDEEENPDVPESFPVSPQPTEDGIQPFPAEAQRVEVGGIDLPTPFDFGWMFLDLGHTIAGDPFPGVAQNWVSIVMSAEGRFSVGYDAIQLDNVCDPGVPTPGG
jgi:hypothetical protein